MKDIKKFEKQFQRESVLDLKAWDVNNMIYM